MHTSLEPVQHYVESTSTRVCSSGARAHNIFSDHESVVTQFHYKQVFVMLPSHSGKDHKDRSAFLKLDMRRENGAKCWEKRTFQVCSTSLLCPCQNVTASNTSQLNMDDVLYVMACFILKWAPGSAFAKIWFAEFEYLGGEIRHTVNDAPLRRISLPS